MERFTRMFRHENNEFERISRNEQLKRAASYIQKGDAVVVMAPTGAGKSTFVSEAAEMAGFSDRNVFFVGVTQETNYKGLSNVKEYNEKFGKEAFFRLISNVNSVGVKGVEREFENYRNVAEFVKSQISDDVLLVFDDITQNEWREDILTYLMSFKTSNISVQLAVHPVDNISLISNVDNTAKIMTLEPMNDVELKDVIKGMFNGRRLAESNDYMKWLSDISGGHPTTARIVSQFVGNFRVPINNSQFLDISAMSSQELMDEMIPIYRNIIGLLPPSTRHALYYVSFDDLSNLHTNDIAYLHRIGLVDYDGKKVQVRSRLLRNYTVSGVLDSCY